MKVKNISLWAIYALCCALIFCPANAATLDGKIIHIADGDLVTLLTDNHEKIKIRLYEIDTPEKAQPYGNRVKQFTASKVGKRQVTVEAHGKDRYGRLVGIVKINKNASLNEELIENGLAWIYEKYCKIPICRKW